MKVDLVSITKPVITGVNSAEDLIAYCARVSNPGNQINGASPAGLLKYLIKHKHWSPFEMVSMCVSIETSRGIAPQILRHRSFSFQEFSQRYASTAEFGDMLEPIELREAGATNRQSSENVLVGYEALMQASLNHSVDTYNKLLKAGASTETARFVLPQTTKTKLYMNGTLRSWIHYMDLRCDEHTQKEHRLLANEVKTIIEQEFPTIYEAVYGNKD